MALDTRAIRPFELAAGETAWPTVAVFLGALLVHLGSALAASAGLWPLWLAVPLEAACAYAQFTVLHDASHGCLSRRAWLNDGLGHLATLVLFGPYDAIRRNHLHHHAHTNDPKEDPDYYVAGETWLSTALRCATALQFHYWTFFARLRRRDEVLARAVVVVGAIAAFHAWAWATGRLVPVLLHWALPAQLGAAALAVTFDYWPHRPHTERGRLRDTAALMPAWLDPFFLRQNLHVVHHLYPTIPWHRYRRVMAVIEPDLRAAGAPLWGFREALSKLKPGPLPA
ncbi:MAG: fatty acid desaturase [Elusimicrobiota bacterium]|nr:fatty acid desaturase [Elusimicrobiota bacterium]